MSCCMRDAVALESRGVPTVILVNDVFKPIAHATRALLGLPDDYVDRNVVWLPHPTSNKSKDALEALIDERIDEIRLKLLGDSNGAARIPISRDGADELSAARAAIAGLADSLRVDGAHLELDALDGGVLRGSLRIGDVACDDGSCVMPTPQIARMVEALVKPVVAKVQAVELQESKMSS